MIIFSNQINIIGSDYISIKAIIEINPSNKRPINNLKQIKIQEKDIEQTLEKIIYNKDKCVV